MEELNENWEVYWYEHHKLNAKPFPVKKYGVERAKAEAEMFLEELRSTGRFGAVPERVPGAPNGEAGVFFDHRMQAWVSLFWRGGRPHARSYSASKYGYDGSLSLAIAKRRDPVDGLLHLGKGGSPRLARDSPATTTREAARRMAASRPKLT